MHRATRIDSIEVRCFVEMIMEDFGVPIPEMLGPNRELIICNPAKQWLVSANGISSLFSSCPHEELHCVMKNTQSQKDQCSMMPLWRTCEAFMSRVKSFTEATCPSCLVHLFRFSCYQKEHNLVPGDIDQEARDYADALWKRYDQPHAFHILFDSF